MKTILQDLYYGNLNPSGKAFLPDSPYGRLVSDLAETEEKLLPLLTSAEKQLYAALVQHNLDIQSLSCEESFIDGFRLGARLILEIFSEGDGYLRALV